MHEGESALRRLLISVCCCICLAVALAGCANSGNVSSSDNRAASRSSESQDAGPNAEVCRKYDDCGCQKYADCMAGLASSTAIDEPGIRECLLKSSCQSLCSGQPDGCPRTNTGPTGPQQSNCSAISCSKNSDCPADCYGGCDGVICYKF